jgi:hypothetical protein
MNRIKTSEIKKYREQYLVNNNCICPLCGLLIDPKDAVLDHSHKSGKLRNSIHRLCNTFLSKIENNITRNCITPEQLTNILRNYESYVSNTKDIIHPTFKTKDEKKVLAKKRAKKRRSLSLNTTPGTISVKPKFK